MTHNIDVQQQDIDMGIRNNMCSCPIANAVRRQFRRQWNDLTVHVAVDYESVRVISPKTGRSMQSPITNRVEAFMQAFDHRGAKAVHPWRFSMLFVRAK